ncbi:MAG: glycerol acyltransferase [Bacteroidia bacterium]|nr:MAG: glycerol acyltransferase [Bacteroidia bacterium]
MEQASHPAQAIQIDLKRVIDSKNPHMRRWMPGFLLRYLERIVHVDEINYVLRQTHGMPPLEFTTWLLEYMEVKYECIGMENIPREGRFLLASNHPLGGMDGLVLIDLFGHHFGRVYFPVNDILTQVPTMRDVFLPINKHGAQKSGDVSRLLEAYQSDAQMLYFPAGLCSRKGFNGQIRDLEWKSSFVGKCIEYQRDIIPLHFGGRNSNFFYNLALLRRCLGIRANIEMLYLVDEMYHHRGARLKVHVGRPIPWQTLADGRKSRKEWAATLREECYRLPGQLDGKGPASAGSTTRQQ